MVKKLHIGAALSAGVVATGAMTLLIYMAPLMGLPKMDLLFALGSLFPGQLSPYILGATIVGSHAGDMISEIPVAMQSRILFDFLASIETEAGCKHPG